MATKIPNGDECKPKNPWSSSSLRRNKLQSCVTKQIYHVYYLQKLFNSFSQGSKRFISTYLMLSIETHKIIIGTVLGLVSESVCALGPKSHFISTKLHVTLSPRPYKVIIVFLLLRDSDGRLNINGKREKFKSFVDTIILLLWDWDSL